MKIVYKQILTCIFLCLTLNIFGQADSIDYNDLDRNRVDSLTAIIDKRNPSKKKLNFTIPLDSLLGEQIMAIEKQTFKTLCKYTLRTNKTGSTMDVKFVELYLSNDSLIKAIVFYDLDKSDFWKSFYYEDETYFLMVSTPRCMRISFDENGQEYVAIADKLRLIKIKK